MRIRKETNRRLGTLGLLVPFASSWRRHTTLAGNPAFPKFGEDLRRLAVRGLPRVASLEALNSVRTPRPLGTIMDEKTAYILAGSFVGFLLARYGLSLFRRLYETEDCEQGYGKSFGTLAREWRLSLAE